MVWFFAACQTTIPHDDAMIDDVVISEEPVEPPVPLVQITLDDYAEIAALLRAQGIDPNDITDPNEQVLLAAQSSYLAGDMGTAIELLDFIAENEALQREIVYIRALVAAHERNWEEAETHFLALLRIDDSDPKALVALAEVYREMEDYTSSQRLFQKSLEIQRDPQTLWGYAKLFQEQKQYVRAESIYDEIIELDPENHLVYAGRGEVRALQDAFVPAVVDYTRAIELAPEYSWHYLGRGKVQAELRRVDKAIGDYNIFIESNSNVFVTYFYRAEMYELSHDYPAARDDYARTLEQNPDFHPAYRGYAVALFATGFYEEALEYLYKLYKEDPYAEYAMLIGLSLYALNRFDVAQKFLFQVIKSTPQDDIFRILLQSVIDATALERAEHRVQQEKNIADRAKGYYYLGAFHEIMENIKLAQKFYEAVATEDRGELFETGIALYKIEKINL